MQNCHLTCLILQRTAQAAFLGLVLMTGINCVPVAPTDGVTRPQGVTDLVALAAADHTELFEGSRTTLRAGAQGGTPPYLFRWDLNGGPDEIEIAQPQASAITVGPFTPPGRYVFRVAVTDSDGFRAMAFAAVEVASAVEAEAPALVVVGEPASLTAGSVLDEVTFEWTVVRGEATLADANEASALLTAHQEETIVVVLQAVISPNQAGSPPTVSRTFEVVAVPDLTPRVEVVTNLGPFTIQLDAERAPLHTANFLLYLDEGFYDGLLFHRIACTPVVGSEECTPFVLQGGGFERVDGDLVPREPTRDPVPSEAGNGLSNGELNSVSLALSGADQNSGTTQFFINLDPENGFLDDQGFTVFGRVVAGIDVIQAIIETDTRQSPVLPENSLPIEDIIMQRVTRATAP